MPRKTQQTQATVLEKMPAPADKPVLVEGDEGYVPHTAQVDPPTSTALIVPLTPADDARLKLLQQVLSEAQVDFLLQRTPKHEIKFRQGRGGMQYSYVEHGYVTERLNFIFGFNWDFELMDKQILEDEVIVEAKLTVRTPAGHTIVKTQFGGSDIKRHSSGVRSGKPISIADDYKAAASDALKKCASLVGIGLDLYGRDRPYDTTATEEEEVTAANKDEPKAQLVTFALIQEIRDMLVRSGMSEGDLCESLQVMTLADLTIGRAKRVIARLSEIAISPALREEPKPTPPAQAVASRPTPEPKPVAPNLTGPITREQEREINTLILEVGYNLPEFLTTLNVTALSDLTESRAIRVIKRLAELATTMPLGKQAPPDPDAKQEAAPQEAPAPKWTEGEAAARDMHMAEINAYLAGLVSMGLSQADRNTVLRTLLDGKKESDLGAEELRLLLVSVMGMKTPHAARERIKVYNAALEAEKLASQPIGTKRTAKAPQPEEAPSPARARTPETADAPAENMAGALLTDKQLKAIYAIGRASKRLSESQVDDRCAEVFGVQTSELTRAEASQFIEQLKQYEPSQKA